MCVRCANALHYLQSDAAGFQRPTFNLSVHLLMQHCLQSGKSACTHHFPAARSHDVILEYNHVYVDNHCTLHCTLNLPQALARAQPAATPLMWFLRTSPYAGSLQEVCVNLQLTAQCACHDAGGPPTLHHAPHVLHGCP